MASNGARTIVVGVDGSATSTKALQWAARFGAHHGARLQPVMSWDYPTVAMLPYPIGLPVPPADAMQADSEVSAAKVIDELVADLKDDVDVAPVVVERGEPGHVVCRVADDLDADLLVVGSRGLGGFKGLILGSVSAHCANDAPCPVAVIPASWDPDAPEKGEVMVGVDGSKHANEAVEWADDWMPNSATLRLVHAWQLPVALDGATQWADPEACETVAERLVEAAAEEVDDHTVVTETVRTDARQQLSELARDADALVIGARGHRGFGRILLGSVASSTIHHLTVPTIVIKDD